MGSHQGKPQGPAATPADDNPHYTFGPYKWCISKGQLREFLQQVGDAVNHVLMAHM